MGNESSEFVILLGGDIDSENPSQADSTKRFELEQNSTIESAVALKDHLVDIIGHESLVQIDGSNVKQVDTSTLQLLLSFTLQRQSRNLETQFIHFNSAALEVAELLGFRQLMKI